MRALAMNVFNEMNRTEHMLPLLKKYQITFSIVCSNQTYTAKVKGGNIESLSKQDESIDVLIEGNQEQIERLLLGNDFLLAMEKRRELTIRGNLRYLLWLESLLYLSNPLSSSR